MAGTIIVSLVIIVNIGGVSSASSALTIKLDGTVISTAAA